MKNRHEFNVYLSANHQFNTNLVLTRSFNSYLNNSRNFNSAIDGFHTSQTLSAKFIQSLNINIGINQFPSEIKSTASFVNTTKTEINEAGFILSIIPNFNFNITQNFSASPISNQTITTGFVNLQRFEAIMKELLKTSEGTPSNVILRMETGSSVGDHYFLVSEWDNYSGSSLDTKTISEMEFEIV